MNSIGERCLATAGKKLGPFLLGEAEFVHQLLHHVTNYD